MAKDNSGWQGKRGLHAKAGKGEKAEGKGFHGHPEEHTKAAKAKKNNSDDGILGKLKNL